MEALGMVETKGLVGAIERHPPPLPHQCAQPQARPRD